MAKRKLSHIWEVIQELDAWMQHSIQLGIDFDTDTSFETSVFEQARNALNNAFPRSKESYEEKTGIPVSGIFFGKSK